MRMWLEFRRVLFRSDVIRRDSRIHWLLRERLTGSDYEELNRFPSERTPASGRYLRADDHGSHSDPAKRRSCAFSDSRSPATRPRERSRAPSVEPVSRRAGLELPLSSCSVSGFLRSGEIHSPGRRASEVYLSRAGVSHGV